MGKKRWRVAYGKENGWNYLKFSVLKPRLILRRGGRDDGSLILDQRFSIRFFFLLFTCWTNYYFLGDWRRLFRSCAEGVECTGHCEPLPTADVTRTPPRLVPSTLNFLIKAWHSHSPVRFLFRVRKKKYTHTLLNGEKDNFAIDTRFYGSAIRHPTQLLPHLRPSPCCVNMFCLGVHHLRPSLPPLPFPSRPTNTLSQTWCYLAAA